MPSQLPAAAELTAINAIIASTHSIIMEPKPTTLASVSRSSCFAVVPEAIRL